MATNDFDFLCARGETAGPVGAQEIMRAQDELSVVFPREYVAFLKSFGALVANGIEVYGLIGGDEHSPPLWQNVVSVTKQLRQWGQDGAEKVTFVPISEDGTGVYFFINTERSPSTEIWAIGPGVKKVVSNNFFDFTVGLSQGRITF